MAFWHADLTTRMGAQSAAHQGAVGCFIFTGMAVLGLVLSGGMIGLGISTILAALEALVALIAGLRLRVGKGAFWGMAAVFLLLAEILFKFVGLQIGPGIVINAVVLVVVIQGVRGALTLRKGEFAEDDAEAFR